MPVEIDYSGGADEDEDADEEKQKKPPRDQPPIPDSALHPRVQRAIELICDEKLMLQQMVEFDLDTKKMPLGKLTKRQVEQGYRILLQIQESLSGGGKSSGRGCEELSSEFYTMIPHVYVAVAADDPCLASITEFWPCVSDHKVWDVASARDRHAG